MIDTYISGLGTTPGMWKLLSDTLAEYEEKLPASLNNAIYALRDGEAFVKLLGQPDILYKEFVDPIKDRRDDMPSVDPYMEQPDNTTNVSNRRALLQEAADTIDGDRNSTYGGPESSFTTIAALWNEYLRVITTVPGDALQPHDVAAMLALLKIARIASSGGTHKDSWLDLAGYAACGWETVDVPVPADAARPPRAFHQPATPRGRARF